MGVIINWKKKQHQIGPMSHLEGLTKNVIEIGEDEELRVFCSFDGRHHIPLPSTKLELMQTMTIKNILQIEKKLAESVLLETVHSLDSLSLNFLRFQ